MIWNICQNCNLDGFNIHTVLEHCLQKPRQTTPGKLRKQESNTKVDFGRLGSKLFKQVCQSLWYPRCRYYLLLSSPRWMMKAGLEKVLKWKLKITRCRSKLFPHVYIECTLHAVTFLFEILSCFQSLSHICVKSVSRICFKMLSHICVNRISCICFQSLSHICVKSMSCIFFVFQTSWLHRLPVFTLLSLSEGNLWRKPLTYSHLIHWGL